MRDYGLNKIFVEGKSDKLFIDVILNQYFGIDDSEIVVETKGKDKLISQPDLTNVRRIEEKAKNLLIFDSDSIAKNGGREIRIKEYQAIAEKLNITFEIYLLPFDNETEGILEDLLNTCLKKEFDFFDNCWNGMLECLKNTKFEKLNIPAQKAFVYSKIDLFKNHRNNNWDYKTSSVYDYTDTAIWNLDRVQNESLDTLISFIENNLINYLNVTKNIIRQN